MLPFTSYCYIFEAGFSTFVDLTMILFGWCSKSVRHVEECCCRYDSCDVVFRRRDVSLNATSRRHDVRMFLVSTKVYMWAADAQTQRLKKGKRNEKRKRKKEKEMKRERNGKKKKKKRKTQQNDHWAGNLEWILSSSMTDLESECHRGKLNWSRHIIFTKKEK